jgi:hypothetical protein
VFVAFGGEKRDALLAHEQRSDVPRFFGATHAEELSWPHAQSLDLDAFACLAFSRSYMPERSTPAGREVAQRARRIHDRFREGTTVTVRYRTVALLGRPA